LALAGTCLLIQPILAGAYSMISVIVPALNEELGIEACLSSILEQSLSEDYEVIVVDGGSRDCTASIACKLADKVVMQRSLGIGGARKEGANAALGDKLAFTDADTIVSKGWLKAISSNLDRYDASTGPVIYQDPGVRSELIQRWRSLYRIFYLSNFYYILGSNMAVRAVTYRQIGGHSDISLLDDYDLSLKLFRDNARIRHDFNQVVHTSSRRAEKLLTYAVMVAYGHYHYTISGDRSRLLRYPKPEEMRLQDLIPASTLQVRNLRSSLEAAQDSFHSRIKRIF
jgi:glycosyltransferase involved in cell wall biosynthesis